MGRGLGAVQREVLEWLKIEFGANRFPEWHRTLDQFVVGSGHRGHPYYPPPHAEGCCCRVCWVQEYGLQDTKDTFGHYQPENWGKGHWCRFYPVDEKRYQDYLIGLNLPKHDPVAKRESYRRAIRTLIDRKLIAVSINNRLVPLDHPDASAERWERGDIRPRWRESICASLTDEWQHPVDMCLAIWQADWANEASDKAREFIKDRGIDSTIYYHYYFRSQLNELRKKGQLDVLRATDAGSWVCDGTRMEGARIIGIRAKR